MNEPKPKRHTVAILRSQNGECFKGEFEWTPDTAFINVMNACQIFGVDLNTHPTQLHQLAREGMRHDNQHTLGALQFGPTQPCICVARVVEIMEMTEEARQTFAGNIRSLNEERPDLLKVFHEPIAHPILEANAAAHETDKKRREWHSRYHSHDLLTDPPAHFAIAHFGLSASAGWLDTDWGRAWLEKFPFNKDNLPVQLLGFQLVPKYDKSQGTVDLERWAETYVRTTFDLETKPPFTHAFIALPLILSVCLVRELQRHGIECYHAEEGLGRHIHVWNYPIIARNTFYEV